MNINFSLAKEKGLIDTNNDDTLYKSIENIYGYFFKKYILAPLKLEYYDKLIRESPLHFSSLKNNDLYKEYFDEYLNLDYIYILNNFFVEKLSLEDIELLKNVLLEKKYEASDNVLDLIKRTYKDVIKNNYLRGEYVDRAYNICYGAAIPKNFASNDSIVIKIHYIDSLNPVSEDIKKKRQEKRMFFDEIINNIKKNAETYLGVKCSILLEKKVHIQGGEEYDK